MPAPKSLRGHEDEAPDKKTAGDNKRADKVPASSTLTHAKGAASKATAGTNQCNGAAPAMPRLGHKRDWATQDCGGQRMRFLEKGRRMRLFDFEQPHRRGKTGSPWRYDHLG